MKAFLLCTYSEIGEKMYILYGEAGSIKGEPGERKKRLLKRYQKKYGTIDHLMYNSKILRRGEAGVQMMMDMMQWTLE